LSIDLWGELRSLKPGMLLQPPVRFDNLLGVRGGGEDLRHQGVWIQGDGGDELLQLCRSQWRGLSRELRGGLIRRVGEPSRHGGEQQA
jgi:hypothetical protein